MRVIESIEKSNNLLANLASELSRISADLCLALVALQELVALEAKLEYHRGMIDSGRSGTSNEEQATALTVQCSTKACELKRLYITICENLESGTQPIDILRIIDERLDRDYLKMFKIEGIL